MQAILSHILHQIRHEIKKRFSNQGASVDAFGGGGGGGAGAWSASLKSLWVIAFNLGPVEATLHQ